MSPAFIFKIGRPAVAIDDRDLQWTMPLPLNRQAAGTLRETGVDRHSVTYGDYFCAARDFITRHLAAIPAQALGGIDPEAASGRQVSAAVIHLVKHGAFYHPSNVVLQSDTHQVAMALNVAVDTTGRDILFSEVQSLERLTREFPTPYVPTVYAHGTGKPVQGPPLAMFAASWFDQFHEFHCTRGSDPAHDRFVVWDESAGSRLLSREQVAGLFRRAAAILTYYYNPFTFEAVLNWHHAAGDFVLHTDHENVDVRLVTVRRYAPFLHVSPSREPDLEEVLGAAVLYLLNLSLRMRLDRIDGVDDLVWTDGCVLDAVCDGWVDGLRRMAAVRQLPGELVEGMVRYAAAHSHDEWMRMGRRVIDQFGQGTDEAALIQAHLADHVTRLAMRIRAQNDPFR